MLFSTRDYTVTTFSFSRLKSLFKYSWKLFLSSLLGAVYTEISPLVIGLRFNVNDLSYYTKGKSFPSMLSTTATSTLSAVLFPVLAKYQDKKDRILEYTRLYMRLSSFIIFPIMLGMFAVSDNFIIAILTEKWKQAAYYIRVFCLCNMFDVIAIGNCETIKAIGRSDVYLKIEVIKKTGYFLVLAVFLFLSVSAKILALAYVACTVIQVLVNSYPNVKLIGYNYKDQIKDLFPNLWISVVMCSITLLSNRFLPHNIFGLIFQILLGILTFLLLCVLTKNVAFLYFVNYLESMLKRRK